MRAWVAAVACAAAIGSAVEACAAADDSAANSAGDDAGADAPNAGDGAVDGGPATVVTFVQASADLGDVRLCWSVNGRMTDGPPFPVSPPMPASNYPGVLRAPPVDCQVQ